MNVSRVGLSASASGTHIDRRLLEVDAAETEDTLLSGAGKGSTLISIVTRPAEVWRMALPIALLTACSQRTRSYGHAYSHR